MPSTKHIESPKQLYLRAQTLQKTGHETAAVKSYFKVAAALIEAGKTDSTILADSAWHIA